MLTEEQLVVLKEILNTESPSGCEGQLICLLQKHLHSICKMETDTIGNLYMYASQKETGLRLMITAHTDEVGFQVTHIDDNGFIYFRGVASADIHTIPGSEVVLLSKRGNVDGVVGKKSPHVQGKEEKNKTLQIEDLWIDCGFSTKEEANMYISPGDYLTLKPNVHFSVNNKRVISKALDNKISVFILVDVIKRLVKMDIPISVIGVATTQEELGCRGSIVAANRIKPDISLSLDVGIASDIPNMDLQQYGKFELGKGVGIVHNANNNELLVQSLISTAKEGKIAYQETIGLRSTGGTETSNIQLSMQGVATANISIPNRYIHSLVEICDLSDVEGAIDLLVKEVHSLSFIHKSQFNLFAINN